MRRGNATNWTAVAGALLCLVLPAAASGAEPIPPESYAGHLQLGHGSRADMAIGLAYRHGDPYAFTRIRVVRYPVECRNGETETALNIKFPPTRRIPHPLVAPDGHFRTIIIDDESGTVTALRGQFADGIAVGTLRYTGNDDAPGRCTSGKLRWRLVRQ